MATTATIDWIHPPNWQGETIEGYRRIIVHLMGTVSGQSDLVETDAIKVNLSEWLTRRRTVPSKVTVERIEYSVNGMLVTLEWDRVPHKLIAYLDGVSGTMEGTKEWLKCGGKADDGDGGTGDIILTTSDASGGDTYDITMTLRLKD